MNSDWMTNRGVEFGINNLYIGIRGSDLKMVNLLIRESTKKISGPLEKFVRKSEKPPLDALRRSFCAYFKCIKKKDFRFPFFPLSKVNFPSY